MRLKTLAAAGAIFLGGFVAGNAFWYLASPLWIDAVVSEALPAGLMLETVAQGSFVDADRAHRGTGTALLLANPGGALLRFEGFEVTNGPDLKVWLSSHPNPTTARDVTGAQVLSLGPLKGNIGDQSYVLPEGTNLAQWRSVVIWCERFGVLFSPAALSPPT